MSMKHSTTGAAFISAAILSACGGGGSDPAPPPPTLAESIAYPNVSVNTGDWFVYTRTTVPTLPVGTSPTERTITRHFPGSSTRVDTTSTFSNSLTSRVYAGGAQVSTSSGTLLCTYSPAYRGSPPAVSSVGDTYSEMSTESCATQPNGTATVRTFSVNGSNYPTELRTIPLGTFSTFKIHAKHCQLICQRHNDNPWQTCWIDRHTGRTVECKFHLQRRPSRPNK